MTMTHAWIFLSVLFTMLLAAAWVTHRRVKLRLRILRSLTDEGIGNVIPTEEVIPGLRVGRVRRELVFLEEAGTVERYLDPEKAEYWKITPKGRMFLKRHGLRT